MDDVIGGLTRVVRVCGNYIYTEAEPDMGYDCNCLKSRQAELKDKYGGQRAERIPDYREEFNSFW